MRTIARFIALAAIAMCVPAVHAQTVDNETTEPMSIDAAFEACSAMQEAVERNDTAALARAASRLKLENVKPFSQMRCKDENIESLDGHFVFNEEFVDSLAAGKDAFANADKINSTSTKRGRTTDGKIFSKSCLVKADGKTVYTFPSRGRQELGVIAEAGGRVAVRIHVTNRKGLNEWHNDNKNAVNGARRYRTAFSLPDDTVNTVTLEVINKSPKDISFVVIGN